MFKQYEINNNTTKTNIVPFHKVDPNKLEKCTIKHHFDLDCFCPLKITYKNSDNYIKYLCHKHNIKSYSFLEILFMPTNNYDIIHYNTIIYTQCCCDTPCNHRTSIKRKTIYVEKNKGQYLSSIIWEFTC